MARVLLYKRAVDAICTNIDLTCNGKTQNGVKIKEEIEEDPTTLNINTTENCTLVRNCLNLIDSKSSSSENNISQKNDNINNKVNELIANSHSAYSGDVNKVINLKRKIVDATEELVRDASSQSKKKRQSSNEISEDTSNAKCKNTSYGTTIDRFSEKRKLQKIAKKKKKRTHIECDICFRKFDSIFACEQHKWYYNSITVFKCGFCKKQYKTNEELHVHIMTSHNKITRKSSSFICNFCGRSFSEKLLLQSHLFHIHNELIYSSNRVKQLNNGSKIHVNTPQKNTTLKTEHEKQRSNNLVKSEELNTRLRNNDLIKTKELKPEESSSHKMSPTKRLRQPTIQEYLELYKKKRDKHSPNKLNIKNGSPIIPKQMTHFTSEQNEKDDVSLAKKPFVKIHADVEMMKTFLDNLPDTVAKDNMTNNDDTNKSILFYRELPYSLRSPRVIPFIQTGLYSTRNKSKNVFKTQSARRNTETEQNVTDLDFWKINMVRFKCKDCIIPLIRCDENPKNNQISTNSATFKTNTSLTVQHNSTSFQEDNIQNKTVLKKVEVSLERLAIFPAITKVEAILDAKKSNSDCFLCKICNKNFSSKLNKQMHIKSYHVAYMSSICNARYKQKSKLCEHYLQEHSIFKLNQCCVCYITLSNIKALKQHLNVHCIKYVQRKNDQYPVDKKIECSKNKEVNKLSHSLKFPLSTSISHESHCAVQEETEEDRNNSLKETSTSENLNLSNIVLKEHHNKNADKISKEQKVAECEKTHSVLCENPNNDSAEKSDKHQMSVIGENSVVANDLLVTEEIETTNESQNSEKLSENLTINDQDIVNAQSDIAESDTKIELCIICGKQFHSHMKLQHHMRIFCNITDICPICGTGFSSKRFLRTHITAAHVPQFSESYTFHCMFCNQGFFKKVELRSHVLHLHGQKMLDSLNNSQLNQEESDKLNTTCNVCYLVYETHDRYTEHMMYYYKNHIFTCSLCKQTFQGMYLFHNHYKLTHYSEDIHKSYTYTCEICNEGFKHESHFYSHKMHVHLNAESSTEIAKGLQKRNHTPEIRLQKSDIFTHLQKQIEQSSDEYTCQICQMRCATVDYLMIHQAIYSNDGHFQCNNCSRRCRTSALLEEHIKLTHTCRDIYNGYVCDICGEVFETTLSLKCHEKHFHPNNVNNADASMSNSQLVRDSYDCLFCDKDFSSASAVTMHIIQVHVNKLLTSYPASKPSSVDNNQEQSIQQSEASFSENSQSQLLQQSVKIQNRWLRYLAMQKKKKISKSSNKVKEILPESSNKSKAISSELSNQVNTVPCESSNQVKTVSSESSNQGNSVLPELSNQVKTVLPASSQGKSVLPEPSNQKESVLPEPSNQVNTAPFEPLIQGKTVLPESSNQVKIILPESSNQVKTVITKPSNQTKPILFKPSHQVKIIKPSNNDKIIQQKVLCHASPHISGSEVQINTPMVTASNKTITPISLPTRSINSDTSSNSESDKFQVNQTSSLNESSNKSITLPSSSNGLKVVIVPPNLKTNKTIDKTIDKKLETMNSYTCPLCAVEYPSLMFFHAHLRYAHAESICKNPVNAQVYLSSQKLSIIKCLLCPSIFTEEVTYKTHLKNFHTHYMYMPYFEKKKINNANNPIAQTNNNRKTIIPEVITLDDDDDIENNSDKHTTEADATPTTRPCEKQNNNKIGRLRVKSFAKIIENLSMDAAVKPK